MAFYKFWQSQPVPQFDDKRPAEEGPIRIFDTGEVSKIPGPLAKGYEWSTLDLDDSMQQNELYELLANHYVEDDNGIFRFDYSIPFLEWALKPPGWKREWHVGVRNSHTRNLVAFLAAIPANIMIRKQALKVAEVDFLCIHRDLRSKRLAPVLIQELTRRCALGGLQQALYTSGTVLPSPISSPQYFHRPLNWVKLYDWGFSPLPTGSTKAGEITKFSLHPDTHLPNIRPMNARDASAVHDLLRRYLERFDLIPVFSVEEIKHWFLQKNGPVDEQVVWAYVVEDSETAKITDMISFYSIDTQCLRDGKSVDSLKVAFLYYYASETAFSGMEQSLPERLIELVNDALILAKKANFDVFNALTVHDNPLFLEKLKFVAGDGYLNYYLYNYRVNPIPGGTGTYLPNCERKGGIGIVLL